MSRRSAALFYALIIGFAIFLRFSLIIFNREANDPHETVANLILRTGRLPTKDDCWECFQPKLYHLTFAVLLKTLGMENNPAYQQNIAGQLINFVAGIITLIIIYIFIKGLQVRDEKLKQFAFALVALNPALIGINSQATNDTFAILFSTFAIYYTYKYVTRQKLMDLFLCGLFAILGVSTKTNAWVTVIAILSTLLIKALLNEKRVKNAIILLIFSFVVTTLIIINPIGQYITNYQRYGSPVLINLNKDPVPHFSGEYSPNASGIWYIGDGFFTFKFVELLRHPRLDPNSTIYLPHQTSFWTVLFGRAHAIHFDNAPPSWSTTGTNLFPLLQIQYIFALIPTALLFVGFFMYAAQLIRGILKKDTNFLRESFFGLFILVFVGYLFFQLLYSFQYRSVTVIKAIFVFPAIISFPVLFLKGGNYLYNQLTDISRRTVSLLYIFLIGLLICYVIDSFILITDLARIYFIHHSIIVF